MGMAQYAVFRSPYNFKDPEIYLPERWLDEEGPYKNDRREALQPFSFGPRNCIGRKFVDVLFSSCLPDFFPPFFFSPFFFIFQNILVADDILTQLSSFSLANIEMRLILAKVLFNFDFELTPECANWPKDQYIYTSWEKIPLKVHITSRATKTWNITVYVQHIRYEVDPTVMIPGLWSCRRIQDSISSILKWFFLLHRTLLRPYLYIRAEICSVFYSIVQY